MEKSRNQLDKFIEFVFMVVNKPGMFNVNNIEDLSLLLLGYSAGISSNAETSKLLDEFILGYRKFINDEFDSNGDYDWARLIRFYSAGDSHSLKLFAQKFEEFTKR